MKIFNLESIKKQEKKNSKEILLEQDKRRSNWQIIYSVILITVLITIIVIESPVIVLVLSILTILLVLLNLVFIPFINELINSAWYDIFKNNETYYRKKLNNNTLDESEKLPDNYDDWRKDWI
jgi:uncharacterized Tic20 family protein